MAETLPKSIDRIKENNGFQQKCSRNPESKTWKDAIPVEAEVFKQAGYVRDSDEIQHTYERYEEQSTMYTLYHERAAAVGEIRIVTYDPETGFKTTQDIEDGELEVDENGKELLDKLDLTKTFEVATIGLDENFRTTPEEEFHPIMELYGTIYTYGFDNGLPNILASFDEKYLERFAGMYGDSLTRLGPAKVMMGSPTVPVLIDLNRMRESFKRMGPEAFEAFEGNLFAIGHSVESDD
jgi:hypothetical protein